MAIYHLTATIISRGRGQSVVAAAAYRLGVVLRDERYGAVRDYRRKRPIVHREIMAPSASPDWVYHRERLWNSVEASEHRKDAQLARSVEVALPVELTEGEWLALLRAYVAEAFVSRGMIADFALHRCTSNPRAIILLTLRAAGESGFGPKQRQWNGKAALAAWRAAWAAQVNEHLARAGHAFRVDHRTLEAQRSELKAARRRGFPAGSMATALPGYGQDRDEEQKRIAAANGAAMLEDPLIALGAITHQRPCFTAAELSAFLRTRTGGAAQLEAVTQAVLQSSELVAVETIEGGEPRFTSRDLLEAGRSLDRRVESLRRRRGSMPPFPAALQTAQAGSAGATECRVLEYLLAEGDLKVLWESCPGVAKGIADAACSAWVASGRSLVGPCDMSRWEVGSVPGEHAADARTVMLVRGAEHAPLKALERLLGEAESRRAKLVLLIDTARFDALRIDGPMHRLLRVLQPPRFAAFGA